MTMKINRRLVEVLLGKVACGGEFAASCPGMRSRARRSVIPPPAAQGIRRISLKQRA